jgi:putative oxidoreductase
MNNALNGPVAAAGRIALALLFLISGFGKITAAGATMGYISAMGLPLPQVALVIAILIEVGGGILLVLGLQARLVALVMAGFTVVTAFAFHHDFADMNQQIHFLKNIAITGGLLQVLAFGAGAWSLDARRGKSALAVA